MNDADDVLRAAAAWIWQPHGTKRAPADDYLLAAMPEWTDSPTQVMRTTSDRDPLVLLDEVRAQVIAWERPWVTWWVSGITRPATIEQVLINAGAVRDETLTVMARPVEGLPDPDPAVEMRVVDDLATFRDFDAVQCVAFEGSPTPEDDVAREVDDLRRAAAVGHRASMVGYVDGVPVTTGGVSMADGWVRLWGGATLPAARRRGAYTAVLLARAAWGRANGGHTALVKGRVETSAPVLARLGFAAYGEERSYQLPVTK